MNINNEKKFSVKHITYGLLITIFTVRTIEMLQYQYDLTNNGRHRNGAVILITPKMDIIMP